MPKAKFYRNFITREKRFANRTAFDTASATPNFIADVVGCFITNTSSYVDIEFNIQEDANTLNNFSYIIFDNVLDGYTYCAFIDRVEPNNFNLQDDYQAFAYRIFITVDWWTTIMKNDYNDNEIPAIKSSLEGNVERAHVDDVQWLPTYNEFAPYMGYTTPVTETIPGEYLLHGKHLVFSSGNIINDNGYNREYNNDILWLYILKRYTGSTDTNHIPPYPFIFSGGNDGELPKTITPCGAYILVVPFKGAFSYRCTIKDTLLVSSAFPIGEITDDDVIHIYTSSIPPCNYYIEHYEDSDRVVLDTDASASLEPLIVHSSLKMTAICLSEIYGLTCLTLKDFLESYNIYSNLIDELSFVSNPAKIPKTYDEYIEKCIYKAGSEIYCRVYISCGDDVSQIMQTKVSTFTLFHDYETGGLILRNYLHLFDQSKVNNNIVIGGNYTYRPLQVVNNLYYYRGMFAVSTSAGSTAFSAMTYNYGAALNSAGATVDKMYSMAEQRRGNIQSQATGSLVNSYIYTPEITVAVPVDIERIKVELSKYGYTTMLQPHEILKRHQRKYFNYIKCNNAKVLVNSYNTEIRLQIEEMFNNGVWLWNTADNFGDFEVPNYPIIMEE